MTILEFVTEKHKGQKRKYTEEPYVNHLIRVASNFEKDSYLYNLALCHDLFEDTDCTENELYEILKLNNFENKYEEKDFLILQDFIANVYHLTEKYTKTNYPLLNRKQRKESELNRLVFELDYDSATVKYADLIDNCDIVLYDKSFGKIYLQEKYEILKHCKQGDFDLYYKAIVKHSEMMKLL
jgi:hypothetical protein